MILGLDFLTGMVTNGRMTLNEYIAQQGITASEFARRLGVSAETVRRYREGERIPRREEMQRIFEVTGGAVAPNDFFPLNNGAAQSEPEAGAA